MKQPKIIFTVMASTNDDLSNTRNTGVNSENKASLEKMLKRAFGEASDGIYTDRCGQHFWIAKEK